MPVILKPKRSETASSVPTTSDLAVGEIAVNTADKKLYVRDSSNNIKAIGGGITATDSTSTADVETIQFNDTSTAYMEIDTSSVSGTAIVRVTVNADQDYGSITDSVLGYNNIDYGSLS